MEATIIRGSASDLPPGSGSGYGDGSGDGSGYGSGYGDGSDIVACSMEVRVSIQSLQRAKACPDQVRKFAELFPDGARWPDDIEKARAAGLDVEWARINLGLLEPK